MFKISRKELAPEIIEKLDQLDKVAIGFDENSPDGYVSYNKNGFYFKKITNNNVDNPIYTEDEITALEDALYNERQNIISSLKLDFQLNKSYHTATRKFLHNINYADVYKFGSPIVISKAVSDTIVVITADGRFIKNSFSENIIEKIKQNFSISEQLDAYDICDVAEIDTNNYLIGTTDFGIYKLTLNEYDIEFICNPSHLKTIEYTHTGNLFVATDEFVAQYDIKTGMKIEKYNVIKNSLEFPKNIIKTDGGLFVVALPAGIQIVNKLLHFWALDAAKVSYNCRDGLLPNHSLDNSYQIFYSYADNDFIYIAGRVDGRIFVWKYSLKDYVFTENILDLNMPLTGFTVINGYYIILSNDKLYVIKDNTIQMSLKLNDNCKKLIQQDGMIYSECGNSIVKIALPTFANNTTNLSYKVYSSNEPCNNIDIFVKGATRNERISLFDADTNAEITPAYYMIYDNNSIIKLINCKSLNIKMSISVNDKSSLGGIAIKTNRLFFKN